MTNDIHLAFADLAGRSSSEDASTPLDRIALRDYIVDVEVGAFQAERGTTQRVRFNIVVEIRSTASSPKDDVDRILSYDLITDAIGTELSQERLNLLETLAERIAERILIDPRAVRVFVRIEKLDRLPGALGVEIVRTGAPLRPVEADVLRPVVCYLSQIAVSSDGLGTWLDTLERRDRPVVLCVGPANTPRPRSVAVPVQRRIDLLAIEQNAWVLAGRDPRCVVVDTRTEIEWALKNGQMIVWAPSKIVLDAVDPPSGPVGEGVTLATWLAHHMHADELILVDAKPEAPVPDLTVSMVTLAEIG
ncbi:MAG: dihydroneopterin aldolase [Pseudomonadota bacterium]